MHYFQGKIRALMIACAFVHNAVYSLQELSVFVETPYVSIGDRLYMECRVTARKGILIQWLGPAGASYCCGNCLDWRKCDGVTCGCDSKTNPLAVSVLVESVTDYHFTEWTCRHYPDTVTQVITEYETPNVTIEWQPDMQEGLATIFTCHTVGGNPRPRHVWYKNDEVITPQSDQDNSTINVTGRATSFVSLVLSRRDSGFVRCSAEQVSYKEALYSQVKIDVKYEPTTTTRVSTADSTYIAMITGIVIVLVIIITLVAAAVVFLIKKRNMLSTTNKNTDESDANQFSHSPQNAHDTTEGAHQPSTDQINLPNMYSSANALIPTSTKTKL